MNDYIYPHFCKPIQRAKILTHYDCRITSIHGTNSYLLIRKKLSCCKTRIGFFLYNIFGTMWQMINLIKILI